MSTETVTRSVVMFPWLAYGHITPFLRLAKNLVDRVELHLPESPHLPHHYQTTNGLPRHLDDALKKVLNMAAPDFAKILKTLNPDLVIHDTIQPWFVKLALSLDIPVVPFFTTSAAVGSYFSHIMNKSTAEFPFPALLLRRYEQTTTLQLLNRENSVQPEDYLDSPPSSMMLVNSSKEVEAKYIDCMSETGSGKTYTLWGPHSAMVETPSTNGLQGIVPRIFQMLFDNIEREHGNSEKKQISYQCHCSFLEVYNGHIGDLLDPMQRNLKIKDDTKNGFYVENMAEEYSLYPQSFWSSGQNTLLIHRFRRRVSEGRKPLELQCGASLSPSTAGTLICWKDLPQPLQEEVPPTAIPTPIPGAGGGGSLLISESDDMSGALLSIFFITVTIYFNSGCQNFFNAMQLLVMSNVVELSLGFDTGIHQEPLSQDSFLTMRMAQRLILCSSINKMNPTVGEVPFFLREQRTRKGGQFLSCLQLISKSLGVNSQKQSTVSMMPSTRNLYQGVERNFHLKENGKSLA
nr:beta-D-glucosyl crocetin beta-1,6-glucosyltransferase-like [Ipomoea batatas]